MQHVHSIGHILNVVCVRAYEKSLNSTQNTTTEILKKLNRNFITILDYE
nr:MAG TPA: hypothetical protein [Caudoviricetes sp.]